MALDLSQGAEIATNERGGRASHIPASYDLLPTKAVTAVAEVLYRGAKKYLPNNWRLISRRSHINHALTHIFAYMEGDTQETDFEEHLRHAATRILFALDVPEDMTDYPYTKLPEVEKPAERRSIFGKIGGIFRLSKKENL